MADVKEALAEAGFPDGENKPKNEYEEIRLRDKAGTIDLFSFKNIRDMSKTPL
jgi:hypothetical protein